MTIAVDLGHKATKQTKSNGKDIFDNNLLYQIFSGLITLEAVYFDTLLCFTNMAKVIRKRNLSPKM